MADEDSITKSISDDQKNGLKQGRKILFHHSKKIHCYEKFEFITSRSLTLNNRYRHIALFLLSGYLTVIFQGYVFEVAHFIDHVGEYLRQRSTHFHLHDDHTHHHASHHHYHLTDLYDAVVSFTQNEGSGAQEEALPMSIQKVDMHHASSPVKSTLICYDNYKSEMWYSFTILDFTPLPATPPPRI